MGTARLIKEQLIIVTSAMTRISEVMRSYKILFFAAINLKKNFVRTYGKSSIIARLSTKMTVPSAKLVIVCANFSKLNGLKFVLLIIVEYCLI